MHTNYLTDSSRGLRGKLLRAGLFAGLLMGAGSAIAQVPSDPNLAPVDGVREGFMIIEGDIIVPEDFYLTRGTYITDLWSDGVVPYEFDSNVSALNRTRALNAMAEWENVADIDFRPCDTWDAYFLHIQNSTENSSMVGRYWVPYLGQDVNIVSWTDHFVIVHELGHALGYWHEQSRSDRNTYVQINWGNIPADKEHNFDIQSGGSSNEYGPYDFDSVMHYGECAFTQCGGCPLDPNCLENGRTITVLPPNDVTWQGAIGQRTHLSFWDARVMSFLYPYDNWRFVDESGQGPFQYGTFFYPYIAFDAGVYYTPEGGVLWVQPGVYEEAVGVWSKPMLIRAPLGAVLGG